MKFVIHPPVEAARLEKITAAAGPLVVVNAASESEALAHMPDADAFFGKITPPAAGGRDTLALGAGANGKPRALPVSRAGGTSVRADQHARAVLRRDRRSGDGLCPLLRPQLAPIRLAAGERRCGRPSAEKGSASALTVGPGVVNAIDRAHRHLGDATVGVVGLGAIGAEVARRAHAFSMRVLAVDPVRTTAPEGVEAVWPVERLPELLGVSDFVVIAAPHTPQTVKLFRRPQFQQMKPSAVLINIGRGAIVDLNDLTQALEANEIAGAALDVFETEPLPAHSPLWKMGERVILTPHVAGYSPRIAERHLAVLLENLGRFVRKASLLNVADKTRWF